MQPVDSQIARRARESAQDHRAARDYLERAAVVAEEAHRVGADPACAVRARAQLCLLALRVKDAAAAEAQLGKAQAWGRSPATPRAIRRALGELGRRLQQTGAQSSAEVLRLADETARGRRAGRRRSRCWPRPRQPARTRRWCRPR